MAIITCPECGQQVSDRAAVCPKCAFPLSELKTDGDVKIRYHFHWPYQVGIRVVNLKTNEVIFECDRKSNGILKRTLEFHVDGETEVGFSFDVTGFFNSGLNTDFWRDYPIRVKVKPNQNYTLDVTPNRKKTNHIFQHVDVIDSD